MDLGFWNLYRKYESEKLFQITIYRLPITNYQLPFTDY